MQISKKSSIDQKLNKEFRQKTQQRKEAKKNH